MPSPEVNTLLGILIVSVISLVGVAALVLPALRKHAILLVLVAFAAGTLLGDSFFHLLPESPASVRSEDEDDGDEVEVHPKRAMCEMEKDDER